ncbi:hypothetical protein Oscil6304_3637 [Oscillatoria acuminata PCC 6304]|uniref:Uncharacterized protein n=1 Tax=Oscillatoria acuminata PCC 6304 TaxID=56110 RepID=K9TKY2_9CYAN|nr:hypothetical protein Oscil6304_3637 [Oscillatoria acuminata PCC 6304]
MGETAIEMGRTAIEMGAYKSTFFTPHSISGPLPLARSGLGWGIGGDVLKHVTRKEVGPASIQVLKP